MFVFFISIVNTAGFRNKISFVSKKKVLIFNILFSKSPPKLFSAYVLGRRLKNNQPPTAHQLTKIQLDSRFKHECHFTTLQRFITQNYINLY